MLSALISLVPLNRTVLNVCFAFLRASCILLFFCMHDRVTILIRAKTKKASSFLSVSVGLKESENGEGTDALKANFDWN